jgi:hypothetical protein
MMYTRKKFNFHDRHFILNQVTTYMTIQTSFPFALHCHTRFPSPPLSHTPYPSYCNLLIFLLIYLFCLFSNHVSMSHSLIVLLLISSSSTSYHLTFLHYFLILYLLVFLLPHVLIPTLNTYFFHF